ncbi:MAG: penicillin-binding protein 2 [Anaerolineales bacterium]|nr:penicillin-binding protein 2 [Anaerolineales bacterium]
MSEGPRRRLQLIGALFVGAAIIIVAQLLNVQIVQQRFYTEWGHEQRDQKLAVAEAPRGVILDRDGHLLAGNGVRYSIEAAPAYMGDPQGVAAELSTALNLPLEHVLGLLDSDRPWVPIASLVSKEVGDKVIELNLMGITVRPVWVREYPETTLAAHALGFCNSEGQGYYGVEGFYDQQLRARTVYVEGPVDYMSDQVPWTVLSISSSDPGQDMVLTIDRTVQGLAEEELARSLQEYQAEGGTIIVMDPRTFDILALASAPNYNPGDYLSFVNASTPPFEDPAVSKQYEPGSVFKVLTVAAALDSGTVAPQSTYIDNGQIEVGGRLIRNSSYGAYGEQTINDILIRSLNVGAAWLSTTMGPDIFYRYVKAFGISTPTGVDLAGEVAGQLWLPTDYEHWYDANLGVNAFGQALAVTPLQMISAIATVANDGTRLRPHIVQRRIAADGTVYYYRPVVEEQVIAPETARIVSEMMVRAVQEGLPVAQVPGYRIAGKTGTAQIPIPGGYDPDGTIVTYVGFGSVPNPSFVILVKLDRPKSSEWAGETAALSFQRLASRLFVVMGVPPDGQVLAEAVQ